MPPAQGELRKYYSTVQLRLASGLQTKEKGQDKIMGKILEALLLSDQFRVNCDTKSRNPKHQEISDEVIKLQKELADTLDDEENEILTLFVNKTFEECCYNEKEAFDRGFRLGFLLTLEIFTEQGISL